MLYNIAGRKLEIQNTLLFDRLSQEESIKKGSHLIHQKRLKDFCINNGIDFRNENEYYFDAVQGDLVQFSAKFQELIFKIKNGVCDTIIAIHPDRLSRDALLSLSILKIIEETKSNLIFIDFPHLDVLDGLGRRMYVEMATRAENEKLDDARRSIAATKEYMKEGYSIGGKAPYGFKKEDEKIVGRQNPAKILVVDNETLEYIRLIFDLFLKLKRIKSVAKELNKLNIVSPKGCKWGTSTIKRILRNPIYMGKWIRNTHKQIKRPEKILEGKKGVYWKPKEKNDWIIIMRNDPIISQEKWETAQDILDNINYRKSKKKMVFLFAGMECASCGNKMFGHRHEKNKITGQRKGKSKYRCKNDLEPHCNHSIEVNLFDTTVINGLKDLSENSDFLQALEANCEEQVHKRSSLVDNIEEMKKEVIRQDKIIGVYSEHIVDGTLTAFTAKEKIKEADNKKRELLEQIKSKTSELDKIITFSNYETFIGVDLKKVIKSLYQFGKEVQRDILKLLIHKITVFQDKIVCQLNYIPRLTEKIGIPNTNTNIVAPIGASSFSFAGVYNGGHIHTG
jgi:site-specific DNA recombinase